MDAKSDLESFARAGTLSSALVDALLEGGSPAAVVERLRRLRGLLDLGAVELEATRVDYSVGDATVDPAGQEDGPQAVVVDWPAPEDPPLPVVPDDRYTLLEMIGQGGMGEVWRCRDHLLERDVALKKLKAGIQSNHVSWKRFCHEARLTARLGHPGIIPVYDFGTLPDGATFYTMQLITGHTLGERFKEARKASVTQGAHPIGLLNIFARICLTVAFAHDRGVIHRDLKPANVLLGAYGEVHLGDWGIAQEVGAQVGADAYTRPGVPIGTPNYMSPEQVRGEAGRYGPTTDVWSLGVMLFELMTHERPFDGAGSVDTMYNVLHGVTPDPAGLGVPEAIAETIRQALVRDPEQRTLTAREMAERLSTFVEGVEDLRRRRQEAAEELARAEETWQRYHGARQLLANSRASLAEMRAAAARQRSIDKRRPVWAAEQALQEKAIEAEQIAARALQLAQSAFDKAESAPAGDLLAQMYWTRAEQARQRRDAATELFFRSRVERYDTGRYRDGLATEGRVVIDAPEAEVRIERQTPFGPIYTTEVVAEGAEHVLPVGSYIARVSAPGRMPARLPFVVEGNCDNRYRVQAPAVSSGSHDFVYVPAGTYAIGGDADAPRGMAAVEARTDGFVIGRHPITLTEYIAFLDALAAADVDRAMSHAPRSMDGTHRYLDFDSSTRRFAVPSVDADGDAWDPRWPALMVNWHDATAYCRWRSVAEGVEYRLPTETEWEIAARGADGRIFPWGNGFDETLCRMADTARGRPLPVPVGSHPLDCSPFGVMDMAGLTAEWTATLLPDDSEQAIQRGGSFVSPSLWCRAATRRSNFTNYVTHHFGFRCVRG